jgi:hypothetical protein
MAVSENCIGAGTWNRNRANPTTGASSELNKIGQSNESL